MNILAYLAVTVVIFIIAYRKYGNYLDKVFDASDSHPTPACAMADKRDYVAGKTPVVFSHHFVSIAGGGPIVGPTVALIYGFMPSWLWIVIGVVLIGAVHDYTVLFVSTREKGKSIIDVTNRTIGKWGFILFILFTLSMTVLVTAAFLGLTATALGSLVNLKTIGLDASQTILRVVQDPRTGEAMGQIGGIASTSVVVMTLFAPLMGLLMYRFNIRTTSVAIIAVIVAISSIFVGIEYPVVLDPKIWMVILSIYVFFASGSPVWLVLQPRDFINSFILYGGIIALFISLFSSGLQGLTVTAPSLSITEGIERLGFIWPILFITIACGAISGFHAIIAGGTTSKQICRESDVKRIGVGAMLLEGLLAVVVLLAVASGLSFTEYIKIVFPEGGKSNPILAFSLSMGSILDKGFSIPIYAGAIFGILLVEGFLITTLDTAVRLNRYLLEELWSVIFKNPPRVLRSYLFNAGLSVALMFSFAYTQAFLAIWPIFGSANQLLAALTLIAVSVWLISRGMPSWFTLIPAG
ncbi:MAG: carbon starvation CstA family protein, partial [Nitrospirota bacterium]